MEYDHHHHHHHHYQQQQQQPYSVRRIQEDGDGHTCGNKSSASWLQGAGENLEWCDGTGGVDGGGSDSAGGIERCYVERKITVGVCIIYVH